MPTTLHEVSPGVGDGLCLLISDALIAPPTGWYLPEYDDSTWTAPVYVEPNPSFPLDAADVNGDPVWPSINPPLNSYMLWRYWFTLPTGVLDTTPVYDHRFRFDENDGNDPAGRQTYLNGQGDGIALPTLNWHLFALPGELNLWAVRTPDYTGAGPRTPFDADLTTWFAQSLYFAYESIITLGRSYFQIIG